MTETVETSPELAEVTAELIQTREDLAAMHARHLDEREGVESEIKALEGRQAHLLSGTTEDELRMARDLIEVTWTRTDLHNEFDAQVVQEAVEDLAAGCLTLRSEYFCRRVYEGHLHRETYPYNFGPRHGHAVFRVGLTVGAREYLQRWGAAPARRERRGRARGDPLSAQPAGGGAAVSRDVALIVERGEEGGDVRPGWTLRAGDRVQRTEYDHDRATIRVVVDAEPMGLVEHLRRWWEGRRP